MERPLFWHQGLFLQPQHFQLHDQYVEGLLKPAYQLLRPHFWGVGDMEIQVASLDNHVFNLSEGAFLFPGSTFITIPGNAVVQPRSFENAWHDDGRALGVYLGLKKTNNTGENVTEISDDGDMEKVSTRFAVDKEPEEIKDLQGSGPSAKIKKLHYVLKIFWESEIDQLGDYELIPLTRLERDGDRIYLSTRYIPPVLTVSSSLTLYKLVKDNLDQIFAKSRQLEAYKRDRGIHRAQFGARDMVYLLALRTLNRYVAKLSHIIEAEVSHPWDAYGIIRSLASELTTFSQKASVDGLLEDGSKLIHKYNHKKLWECFSGVKTLITMLLDEITAGPEYVVELLFDGTYFTADLQPSTFEGGKKFYLLMETQADPEFVIQSMNRIAKLCSREYLPILIAKSLPGVNVTHMETPPQELPRRSQAIYFEINHHSDHWVQVENTKNMAIYWDSAPEDLKVELMAVGGS